MPPNKPTNEKNDPERIKFINFLIEKAKDAKSPLSVRELAREYKENNGASQEVSGLISRIGRFRSKIHQMDSIDMEMKVTMLFALGAHIDENFLNESSSNHRHSILASSALKLIDHHLRLTEVTGDKCTV
ncbi:unnamed protein product [Caenorhabditis brenneri]